MHVPVETVATAESVCTAIQADLLVAAGGGSTIGLAKGLALRNGLPILAIPTTYARSEMTPIGDFLKGAIKQPGAIRL